MAWKANAIVTTRTYRVGEWDNVLKVDLTVRFDREPYEFSAVPARGYEELFPGGAEPVDHIVDPDVELDLRREFGLELEESLGVMANQWLNTMLMRRFWEDNDETPLYSAKGGLIPHPFDRTSKRGVSKYDEVGDWRLAQLVEEWDVKVDSMDLPVTLVNILENSLNSDPRFYLQYITEDSAYAYQASQVVFEGPVRVVNLNEVTTGQIVGEVPSGDFASLRGCKVLYLEFAECEAKNQLTGQSAPQIETTIFVE